MPTMRRTVSEIRSRAEGKWPPQRRAGCGARAEATRSQPGVGRRECVCVCRERDARPTPSPRNVWLLCLVPGEPFCLHRSAPSRTPSRLQSPETGVLGGTPTALFTPQRDCSVSALAPCPPPPTSAQTSRSPLGFSILGLQIPNPPPTFVRPPHHDTRELKLPFPGCRIGRSAAPRRSEREEP